MTIFRSEGFLSLASAGIFAFAVWSLVSGIKSRATRFGGVMIKHRNSPMGFSALMAFYVVVGLILAMVLMDLLFGFDARFWLTN